MTEDGIKDAIRRSVDRIRYSFARTHTSIGEENSAREYWSLSWERNRVLGASVVRYSIGESPLSRGGANELLSGRTPGFIVIC